MARKDLLKGLMTGGPREDAPAPAPQPRMSKGAIGAVSQSIADLRNRSVIDVPADMIDHAGLHDRLDDDPEGIAALAESIRDYGQQVPVLLRHSPNVEGRFDVVYGRRRVAAMKLLRQPVKAIIRNLTDRDLVIAQGQENAARRDLSFIEKVNFARQMRDDGFDRKVICDALHIDKTLISRMLSIADSLPPRLIRAIGAAPGIGRDRWMMLAERIAGRDPEALAALAQGTGSDARFEAVLAGLKAPRPVAPPAQAPLEGAGGVRIGEVSRNTRATVITLSRRDSAGFDDWLVENLEEIHRRWSADEGE